MIPIVLVAGILSGTLLRSPPPAESVKGNDSNIGSEKELVSAPAPWVSDLRPVLDSLTPALGLESGVSAPEVDLAEPPVRLEKAGEPREAQVFAAMASLRTGLDTLMSPKAGGCAIGSDIDAAAHVLAAWRLTDEGGDSKALGTAAKTLLEELGHWQTLVTLTNHVKNHSTPKYRGQLPRRDCTRLRRLQQRLDGGPDSCGDPIRDDT